MADLPLLSLVTFFPLLGVAFLLWLHGDEELVARNARRVALGTTVITLILSLFIWKNFNPEISGFQFVEKHLWIEGSQVFYHLGVDGISMPFVALSALLTMLCIIASWRNIKTRVREYMMAFLVLETFMIGMFCALDLVMFYIFFEGVLIPMFFIIGVWGGDNRVYAAFKLFLYTLLGSVLMLLAFMMIYLHAGTTDITSLMTMDLPIEWQNYVWLAFFASFAVKVPMWPVHTWLPDAHVQAPTAGSVILAGILLKMGAYGFIRLSMPILPHATLYFTPMVYALSVIAIIYTSLVALAQKDMKKLIAYSSIAHMGFVTLGIFAATSQSMNGAVIQMISHGLVSGALFLCVGVVYDRIHSRNIADYGGIVEKMPIYATLFMFFIMASIGLPGTSGFVGEFLVLIGAFKVAPIVTMLAATGVILGAAYALYLYRRVVFGVLTQKHLQKLTDVTWLEIGVFAPLVILTLYIGIYPDPLIKIMGPAIDQVLANYQTAIGQ